MAFLQAQAAKEVFAHVIVGNTQSLSQQDWETDMKLAKSLSIDGFVFNVGFGDDANDKTLATAFKAANAQQFKGFLSLDYLGGPKQAFPKADALALVQTFAADPAYFKVDGKPFVSTFEGPAAAGDWPDIKKATNCFFVPDWSSLGAPAAVAAGGGVADGLFSFDAWPNGDANITTKPDKDFQAALTGGKKYMMPVSPWFFTNLPGFNKNWMWRGDNLWDTRWAQVMEVNPDFVEILTWNDWGESHYINNVRVSELGLFDNANAPVKYAANNPHTGWQKFLPFYIAQYKAGGKAPAITKEDAYMTYRKTKATACPSGGTTGNNKAFGNPPQVEVPPETLVEDSVFFAALLNSDEGVTVEVTFGGATGAAAPGGGANGTAATAAFTQAPAGGKGTPGVYLGAIPIGANTGAVTLTVKRAGAEIAKVTGPAITTTCEGGVQNWNAVAI
ncbi:glycoside hydrolase family 71 protein [Lasiosphaeria miniovina]|uniref:Glycoside hydrolase family 71 protein n=1 Tax=Lasiosphaeria miniovina TaxID=1954250 RepID=A0AA40AJ76_9PEZI|nr:glycoside hydrolase family 71 protein [Lasiosphaeria miniovina]KAK0716804.1 glycoside hydrolase family 71 protein [Lasiosphaeria miniovina]